MNRRSEVPTDLLYRAIRRLLEKGQSLEEVGNFLRQRLDARGMYHVRANREAVKPLLGKAIQDKLLAFVPPESERAYSTLSGAIRHPEARGIHVVDVDDDDLVDVATAEAAGDVAFELIETIATEKRVAMEPDATRATRAVKSKRGAGSAKLPEVHLGIGCGRTTRLVGERLGQRLQGDGDLRKFVSKIVFHAISCGFDPLRSLESPVAIFTLLENAPVPVEFVGLFSDAVVDTKLFDKIRQGPGVRASFERRGEIDIVITSMSGKEDEKGLWNEYARDDTSVLQRLEEHGWIGDVQFRPFSLTGPITADVGMRAVTLFNLEDFVRMAKDRRKAVLLVAPAKDGLGALIGVPSLRVFSHLVTDVGTVLRVYPGSF